MRSLSPVRLGLEKVLNESVDVLRGARVGLICNQASVDHRFRHSADLFFEHPDIRLAALFGPQHGIRGDVQDNMIETGHSVDMATGLPVFSLYSETREPTEAMLADLDTLVFDLQDIGGRVYTFIYTMANAMRACRQFGRRMVVLDRPNPINGVDIEGNVLESGHESFVGQFPIPMRHGMTAGELAVMFNEHFGIGCDLEVVKMDGWDRTHFYDETDGPWVLPSPNMPTVDTAVVFPGTVFFEGTEVSEGRGTTRPFEMIGAPYIDSRTYAAALNALALPGAAFRAIEFIPTFQKHQGVLCGGAFVHVTDRRKFLPVLTGLAMTKLIFDLYPDSFLWKTTAYEYVFDRNPFDVIAGSTKIRELFEARGSIEDLGVLCRSGNEEFARMRDEYLLYGDT